MDSILGLIARMTPVTQGELWKLVFKFRGCRKTPVIQGELQKNDNHCIDSGKTPVIQGEQLLTN